MSCEQAYSEYLKALNAKTPIEEETTALMLSFVHTAGQPVVPVSGEMFERADRLMRKEKAAVQRFLAARDAWFEAAKRHRD